MAKDFKTQASNLEGKYGFKEGTINKFFSSQKKALKAHSRCIGMDWSICSSNTWIMN